MASDSIDDARQRAGYRFVMVDVIVVGSGASAVNASVPLIEAGLSVRLLDVGHTDEVYASLIPSLSFAEIRRHDPEQHRYFLGDGFEGLTFSGGSAGPQLTPPRAHVMRDSQVLAPTNSRTFFPLQSFAAGGLAAAWGAGCPPFDDVDLDGMAISRSVLAPHYERVAARIGVSGANDDLRPFFGDLEALLPPLQLDANGRAILERYADRKQSLASHGFFLGRPRLAVASVPVHGRGPCRYLDMEFWADADRSVYRPQWTLEDLSRRPGFEYLGSHLVMEFSEPAAGGVDVLAENLNTKSVDVHRARALVLAAGTLGTTRIVLRSLRQYGRRAPIVCNPHSYAPLINLSTLGRAGPDPRHSLAQLCFAYVPPRPPQEAVVGHLYSYGSLLSFKLVREAPLPYREGLQLIRHLQSAISIVVMQHADEPTDAKFCVLHRAEGSDRDRLEIKYSLGSDELARIDRTERAILRCLRKLRCVSLRRIRGEDSASVHYAGTLPMTSDGGPLTTTPDGRLRETRAVYVVDGSLFPRLPSKGLTFTMMANADRIGVGLSRLLRS